MAQGAGFNFHVSSVALSEKLIGLNDPMSVAFVAEGVNGNGIDPSDPNVGDNLPNLSDYTEVSGGTYAAKALIAQATSRVAGLNQMTATPFTGANKWDSDPAGPTNIKTALLYVTATGECLAGWDLTPDNGSTPVSLAAGPINLNFGSGSGVVYRAQA